MDPIAEEQSSENLGQLYERHSPGAFRLAYLLMGDRDAAEDLVQDAFVKLIGRFADLRRSTVDPMRTERPTRGPSERR